MIYVVCKSPLALQVPVGKGIDILYFIKNEMFLFVSECRTRNRMH